MIKNKLKTFHLSLITLAVLLLMASCNDKEVLDDVNEKTLLVYFPWSGSSSDTGLLSYLNTNIKQFQSAIATAGELDSRRILVFIANSTSEANLYELTYSEGASYAEKNLLKSYGAAQRYSTKEGIQEVLQDVKSLAPALNYAFITGGHGCGWTPATAWQKYPVNGPRKSFGSLTDLKNYGIDVDNLASAINDAGMHMQYILFDNCYMQNVETAYSLKDVTNFLIGSTIEIASSGMPYSELYSQLVATAPNYQSITSAYYKYYKSSFGTLSVIDCRQMNALAKEMKRINDTFLLDEDYTDSIQALDGYSPHLFYDLRDYTRVLSDSDSLSMHKVDSLLKLVVRSEVHTAQYYTGISPKGYHTIKTHSGLTISDPSEHPVALRKKEETLWWKATH